MIFWKSLKPLNVIGKKYWRVKNVAVFNFIAAFQFVALFQFNQINFDFLFSILPSSITFFDFSLYYYITNYNPLRNSHSFDIYCRKSSSKLLRNCFNFSTIRYLLFRNIFIPAINYINLTFVYILSYLFGYVFLLT
jgi:hypothetical protein